MSLDAYLNRYEYASGDPMNYRDLLGLKPQINWIPESEPADVGDDGSLTLHEVWEWLPSEENEFAIVAHGGSDHLSAFHRDATPEQVWGEIQATDAWKELMKGKESRETVIKLWVCNTGVGGKDAYAQQLANVSGHTVRAPDNVTYPVVFKKVMDGLVTFTATFHIQQHGWHKPGAWIPFAPEK